LKFPQFSVKNIGISLLSNTLNNFLGLLFSHPFNNFTYIFIFQLALTASYQCNTFFQYCNTGSTKNIVSLVDFRFRKFLQITRQEFTNIYKNIFFIKNVLIKITFSAKKRVFVINNHWVGGKFLFSISFLYW
jgi:hypothetical protein